MNNVTIWLDKFNRRKYLRFVIVALMLLSLYAGLKGLYIDLYNPGSELARTYSQFVNYLFVATILFSLPLLFEKILNYSSWTEAYESGDNATKRQMIGTIVKPLILKIVGVFVLALIIAWIFTSYLQVSPDVIQNYQNYYSTPKIFSETINNTSNNNILLNLTNGD